MASQELDFGPFIFGCAGPVLNPEEERFFQRANPFGFILFARNITSADQLKTLCASLRAVVGWHAPILIDQEGGRVQRLRPPLARDWPPPLEDGRDLPAEQRAAHIQDRYQAIARELSGYGIDVNCAPCLDIARAETHPILQNRCFSNEATQVAVMGAAAAQGLADEGVLPVLKHMPGHGLARVDSHLQLPRVGASLAELRDNDFKPFAALKDWPMAMSAHVVYEVIDDLAATISPKMITLIREEIGFDGLLMSDDISMDALGGSLAERSTAALAAGCDVILHCDGGLDDMQQIAAASGVLSPEGQRRAFAALHRRSAPFAKDG